MMSFFQYINSQLCAEAVPLSSIADQYGTPCYVYSRAAIEQQWQAYNEAFANRPHLICYAVKANSNVAVLNILARLGSGFDIVSAGELERVITAGGDPSSVIFSGVGKTTDDMQRALQAGIKCFNVESEAELMRLNSVSCELGMCAPVSLRVNPDVDAKTHPYISTGLKKNKFGVPWDQAITVYREAVELQYIEVVGIDCHIGSQITEVSPFVDAVSKLMELVQKLEKEGIKLQHIDIGGGLGIAYEQEAELPTAEELISSVYAVIDNSDYEILVEPGRSIVGNAGVLLTKVEYLKEYPEKNFTIVDAAMNDLLRPALYGAWQEILPVIENSEKEVKRYDVVGPVCETGDFLGLDRSLSVQEGDLLAVCSAGAYGFTMSSNYNSRARVAEIMVDGDSIHVVRQREDITALMAGESIIETLD